MLDTIARRFILLFLIVAIPLTALGESSDEEAQIVETPFSMHPDFVTNLSSLRVKGFLRLRVVAYTTDEVSATALSANQDLLRDRILLLLNSKTRFQMNSKKIRQTIKQEILVLINKLLQQEEPSAKVTLIEFDRMIVE